MFQQMRLGLDDAERARDAILAALTPTDSPAALAIADEHGVPILLLRQDDAPARMLSRARAKAYTAANLGLDTIAFRDAHVKAQQRTLDDWSDPLVTTLQGGLAIRHDGQLVGGIAMSGNSTTRDEALAQIGLDALSSAALSRGSASLSREGELQQSSSASLSREGLLQPSRRDGPRIPPPALAEARLAAKAVLAGARPADGPLAISIVAASGTVVYQLRQDGATPVDVRNAERKAVTAAYIGRDTSMWRLQIRHDGRTVADWANPQLTTLHGGWTLRRDSQVVGGLGVSGSGDEDRDEQLALRGAEALAQLAVDEWRSRRGR